MCVSVCVCVCVCVKREKALSQTCLIHFCQTDLDCYVVTCCCQRGKSEISVLVKRKKETSEIPAPFNDADIKLFCCCCCCCFYTIIIITVFSRRLFLKAPFVVVVVCVCLCV